MAGDRREPGLGKSSPDSGDDKSNAQDDFLDLIPERLAPRSRAPEHADGEPPLAAEPAGGPEAPRAEDLGGRYAEDDADAPGYDDEDEGRSGGSRGVMAAVVIGAVAAGIAGWYLFLREEPQQVAATTPVITADDQPYKVKPADPGGMDVPDTDKMVYDRLGQNTEGGEVENLLPEPATPTAPPAAPPAPADAGGTLEPLPEADVAATPEPGRIDEPETAAAEPEPAPEPQPTQQAEAPAQAEPTPAAKPAEPASPAQAIETEQTAAPATPEPAQPEQQAAAPTPEAPKPTATAPSGGGNQMVQLAALRDQAGAEAAWKKLQAANPDLLGTLSLDVQRADLGDKGIFFRVRAKGLASTDAAKALCDKLKARDQGCLVVH